MKLRHPEWLQLQAEEQTLYGYNQQWYKTSFQQTRGCGPTAATMQLLYLNKKEGAALPYTNQTLADITQVLENVWGFITPEWLLGLNSTQKFCKGMQELLSHYGLGWRCRSLSIPLLAFMRPSLSEVVQFVEGGLWKDCPIAFLNLHRGKATELESWHWITLVSLEYNAQENQYIATCYDAGKQVSFDLGLWLATSRLGGGFVYIDVKGE